MIKGTYMKTFSNYLLIILNVFLGVGGLLGGISFVTDTSGGGLGAKLSWLEKTPVDNYLVPGIYILIVYGIAPLLVLIAWKFHVKKAMLLNALIGFSLIPWIIYQFVVLSEKIFLQYIMITLGVLIFLISFYTYRNDENHDVHQPNS